MQKWKRDGLLILGLLLAGLLLLLVSRIMAETGSRVLVRVNGEEYGSYSLDRDVQILIEGYKGGHDTLVIEEGRACVRNSDCPDHLCEGMGWIDSSGESIVCLPNRVVVTVEAGEGGEVDAVAR